MKIKIDSRKVEKNDTFIAVRGIENDGHKYIEAAIANGASKIIAEEGNYSVETEIVSDTKKYLVDYLESNYLDKIKNLKKIGVTGTNGKTTTCYLIYQLLNTLGVKSAYMGTIGFFYGDVKKDLANTTPDIYDLYDMFLECLENDVEYIVMEVSSHALALERVRNTEFEVAGFSNLTKDHLDFHLTEENYIEAKKKLFYQTTGFKIINGDDPLYENFLIEDNNLLYGFKSHNDVLLKNDVIKIDGTSFEFEMNNEVYKVNNDLVGSYNIYNFMMAVLIANKVGFDIENVLEKSKDILPPPGRTEIIKFNNRLAVVDYAHTPDAVLNILENTNLYKEGKVYTIVGCGGNRDTSKRPIMGDIATRLSDYVIFTNDNSRKEDPSLIMNDIVSNLDANNFEVILDRGLAIKKGVELLEEKDILLILGKGHENYQIVGTEKSYFSDKDEVLKNIENKKLRK